MFDLDHIKKTYFKLAVPVVISLVFTLIYNLADTYFIAQTENYPLITGVTLCSPMFTALMAFGNIFAQGGSSLMSRYLGAKNEDGVKRITAFGFYFATITGVVISLVLLVLMEPMLKLLGASQDTYQFAKEYYLFLGVVGAPFVILSFVHTNYLRCEGMPNQSMAAMLIGTILNIILDPIFITTLNLGAMGAAIATVIGYAVTSLVSLIIVLKKSKYISLNIKNVKISKEETVQIFGVGITAAITNIMQSVSAIILNRFLLPYGEDLVAVMGMVIKVTLIPQLILTGFSFGSIPLFGYLFGSKNNKKVKELIIFLICFLGSVALVLTGLLEFFASPVMSVFIKDQALLAEGAKMLRLQVVTTLCVELILLTQAMFQSRGYVVPALVMSLSRQGVIFAICVIVLSLSFKYNGILIAQAVSDVISVILGGILIYNKFIKNKSLSE